MKKTNIFLYAATIAVGGVLAGIGMLRYKNKKENVLNIDAESFDDGLFSDDNDDISNTGKDLDDEQKSSDEDKQIKDLALYAVDFLLEDAMKRDEEKKSLEEMEEGIKRNTDEITSLWEHIEALYKKDSIKKEDIKKDRG